MRETARAFVEARRNRKPTAIYPGRAPTTLDEAYAIQEEAIAVDGRRIAGWKVGRVPADWMDRLGVARLVGPIFEDQIVRSGTGASMSMIAGGFGAAEAELMLAVTPNGPLPLNADSAAHWVTEARVGFEIASSPYARINADGPLVTISDFGNHNGLLLGPVIRYEEAADLLDIGVTLRVNGGVCGSARPRSMLDGPFGSVAFVAVDLARRGRRIEPGQWISTGAITGVHQVAPGDDVEADFGPLTLRCVITAA